MQLIFFLLLLKVGLAAQEFALIVIRAGSSFQYNAIFRDHDALMIGQKSGLRLRLNDNGSLTSVDRKQFVYLDEKNELVLGSKSTGGFVINNGYLINSVRGLFACPEKDNKLALGIDCANGMSVALKVMDVTIVDDGKINSVPPLKIAKVTDKMAAKKKLSTQIEKPAVVIKTPPSNVNEFYSQPGETVKFGVIVLRPNSQFQYSNLNKVAAQPNHFMVGGYEGLAILFVLKADGTLVDQYDVEVFVNPENGEVGSVDTFGVKKATKGFTIYNSRLMLDLQQVWKACPSGKHFALGAKDCTGGTSIGLRVVHPERM